MIKQLMLGIALAIVAVAGSAYGQDYYGSRYFDSQYRSFGGYYGYGGYGYGRDANISIHARGASIVRNERPSEQWASPMTGTQDLCEIRRMYGLYCGSPNW